MNYFRGKQNLRFEITVLKERLGTVRDTQMDLKTLGREAEILFDEETADAILQIQIDASIVAGKVHKYRRSIQQLFFYPKSDFNELFEDYMIAFYDPKTDEVYPRLDATIVKLEDKLKRYLPHK